YRILKEAMELPVQKYDLVLNDFECITSIACSRKKVKSVNFGHQASFLSPKTPRPEKISKRGEWILRNFARTTNKIGLHFKSYDDFIFSPVIKNRIVKAEPVNDGHITVYLPSYCDEQLRNFFIRYKEFKFEIFSHRFGDYSSEKNLRFIPVTKKAFDDSLISCFGLVTGGGFETPAEAIHLKKKLLAIPIKGQYEQQCNAAALRELGISVADKLDKEHFEKWLNSDMYPPVSFEHSTQEVIDALMSRFSNMPTELNISYPDLIFS
ncbi:MAG: glycosyl transferase, partial [Chitinophagaceae bacterium]|nr:glycosyl transferase [Chitinophagaceae bacterium]